MPLEPIYYIQKIMYKLETVPHRYVNLCRLKCKHSWRPSLSTFMMCYISTNVILLTVGMTTKFMFIPILIQLMNVAKKDTVSYRAIGFEYDVVI